jgi:signal transduction histidine kinase/DNA-binding LytR/AlgR family response regulator
MSTLPNRRILVVDDTPAIHEDFRKILQPDTRQASELDAAAAALFGPDVKTALIPFDLDSACQGQEGLRKVCEALQAGRPFAVAFIDMRMPPGWDGVETIERLWQEDPRLQIVICTAYTDHSWEEILERLDVRDRLVVLKKPFDSIEVCQLASALTAKWEMTQQAAAKMIGLEEAVRERTEELSKANAALLQDIVARERAEALRAEHGRLLEMIATGSPLEQVLEGVARFAESQIEGATASIRLLSDDGPRPRHGAAPSLPETGTDCIDGIAIGPQAGSCGTAMHPREPVIVTGIPQDPMSDDCRAPGAPPGMHGCWSMPILSHQGRAVGTFAIYSRQVRELTAAEKRLIGTTAHIAGIAIERKHSEEQLRQSQKMEAIGQLTGGLSHDLNNLLAIIIGNLDLLHDEISGNPDADEIVNAALEAALRGADLNQRLLAFARRQPLQPKQVELNSLVTGMMKLLSRTLGEHIEVVLSMTEGLWPISVDPTQLESALTNLAVNARDAMPSGGRLAISTRSIVLDSDYADARTDVRPGEYVVLEVSDSGTGMPPEILARVFEPFFTTKPMDKGTGLGLSMVFGFIKQSGGHVEVYSEVGFGTTVRLYFPRAAAASGAGTEVRPAAVEDLPGGNETVLAVEDNDVLRRLLVKQLGNLGYRVLEAMNAQTAIDILKRDDRIDLLLTDIVLPGGMNGPDLARAAGKMRGDLKVLFTSGFPDGAFGSNGVMPEGAVLLPKPYRKEELAQRVRESLAA